MLGTDPGKTEGTLHWGEGGVLPWHWVLRSQVHLVMQLLASCLQTISSVLDMIHICRQMKL